MDAALCFDGVESAELIRAAAPFFPAFERIEVWCAYGEVLERELAYVLERHGREPHGHEQHAPRGGGGPHPPNQRMLDREQAESIAGRAAALLLAEGVPSTVRIVTGRDAGHALVEAAGQSVTLVIAAGHRPGVGPKSVGHVARFVVDHARGPVVVLRLPPEPPV